MLFYRVGRAVRFGDSCVVVMRYTDDQIREVRALWKRGMTLVEIALETGIPVDYVRKVVNGEVRGNVR